jgi:hypothetical protein
MSRWHEAATLDQSVCVGDSDAEQASGAGISSNCLLSAIYSFPYYSPEKTIPDKVSGPEHRHTLARSPSKRVG